MPNEPNSRFLTQNFRKVCLFKSLHLWNNLLVSICCLKMAHSIENLWLKLDLNFYAVNSFSPWIWSKLPKLSLTAYNHTIYQSLYEGRGHFMKIDQSFLHADRFRRFGNLLTPLCQAGNIHRLKQCNLKPKHRTHHHHHPSLHWYNKISLKSYTKVGIDDFKEGILQLKNIEIHPTRFFSYGNTCEGYKRRIEMNFGL